MIDKGTFIELDYTGKTNGKVFDTTIEKIGKKEGFKNREYTPIVIKVGEGNVIKGLDEALKKMKEGEKKKIEIPPEKGYGQRNPKLIKIVPISVFKKNDIQPMPGMILNLDNMPARVQSVSGGRVRVDFNHELAGKNLEFDVKINKILKTKKDIVDSLTNRIMPKAKATVKAKTCSIKVSEMDKEYPKQKQALITKILMEVDGIEKVEITEEYKKKTGKNI